MTTNTLNENPTNFQIKILSITAQGKSGREGFGKEIFGATKDKLDFYRLGK